MRLSVCRSYEFDAAHKLPNHSGKCKNLHGHTYRLEVELRGEPQPVDLLAVPRFSDEGMVLDFGDIDDVVKRWVINKLDHSYLNDIEPVPTAERMVVWIVEQLVRTWAWAPSGESSSGPRLERVRLYETPRSYAEWRTVR